jgi:hypothetical protein
MEYSPCATTLRHLAGAGSRASTAITRPRGASLVVWKYNSSPFEPRKLYSASHCANSGRGWASGWRRSRTSQALLL